MSDVVALCPTHARQILGTLDATRDLAKELLGPIDNFQTTAAVNHALGRIFVMLAGNRIPRSQAASLTYVCQLMLQTLKGVKQEFSDVTAQDWLDTELSRVLDSLPALSPRLGARKT